MTDRSAPTRAALYLRVSSSLQERHGSSLETQEASCREYATEHGYEVAQVFREVFTGAAMLERPELTKLRELMRDGSIDVIVVHAQDRISRDVGDRMWFMVEASRAAVVVESVTDPIDESTPEGQLQVAIKGYVAHVERLSLIERTTRGRKRRVESGKLMPGGKPLYGYRWPDEYDEKGRLTKARLVENAEEAAVVRRAFEAIAGGATLRALARSYTEEGIPTPTRKSNRWNESTIASMLHKPAYKGEAYGWGWCKSTKETPQNFDPEKAVKLPDGTIPPLVSAELWDAAQRVLTRNKARAIRRAREPEAALLRNGFVTCGYCHRPLAVRPRSNGNYDYVCRTGDHSHGACIRPSITTHILDAAVWAKATEILMNPSLIADRAAALRDQDPTEHHLASITEALARVERQQGIAAQAVTQLDNADAAAPLLVQLQHLAEQHRSLSATRHELLDQQQAWQAQRAGLDQLEQWAKNVQVNLATLSYAEKRLALDAYGFSATLYKADHSPRFEIHADIRPDRLFDSSAI